MISCIVCNLNIRNYFKCTNSQPKVRRSTKLHNHKSTGSYLWALVKFCALLLQILLLFNIIMFPLFLLATLLSLYPFMLLNSSHFHSHLSLFLFLSPPSLLPTYLPTTYLPTSSAYECVDTHLTQPDYPCPQCNKKDVDCQVLPWFCNRLMGFSRWSLP